MIEEEFANYSMYLALGTHKATHVFNNANHWNAHLSTETYLLPDISEGDLLWRCDDHSSINPGSLEVLCDGQVLIRSARRCVNDQVI